MVKAPANIFDEGLIYVLGAFADCSFNAADFLIGGQGQHAIFGAAVEQLIQAILQQAVMYQALRPLLSK